MSRTLITAILLCVYFVAECSSAAETLFESHAIKSVDDPELVGLETSARSKSISASSSIFIKGSRADRADDEFDEEEGEFPDFSPDRGGHRHRHRLRTTTRRRHMRRTTITTRRPRRATRTPRADNVNDVNVQNNVKVRNSGGRSSENKINVGSNVDIENDDEGIF